jgi:hypothetical protein
MNCGNLHLPSSLEAVLLSPEFNWVASANGAASA